MASAAPLFAEWSKVDDDLNERIARLSRGQLQCLELVNLHLSSKEIAGRLGISSHTVDQRIRQSLHTLRVERRSEAARLVAASGAFVGEYQRLIHQPPYIDVPAAPPQNGDAVSHQIRHADRAGEASSAGVVTEQTTSGRWASLPLPFATRSQPRNEMSVGSRLLWIMIIAMGATFSAGMYLASLESLSRMLSH